MASEVACALFSAVCGSSTATAATIGSIAYPEMKKYGYSDKLSTASVAAGGGIGIIFPPSTIFVLYGISTEQSIAKLFLAGILPGVLLTFLYIATIWVVTRRDPSLGPAKPGPRASTREIFTSLRGGLIEVFAVFVISVGGLLMGFFTPTEAGGVGAAGVLLVVSIFGRQINFKGIVQALADTTRTSAMILFLVAGAMIFSRFMAVSRIPFELASFIGGLTLPPAVVLLIILAIYLFFGTFIEIIPLILLTVPIFFPIVVNVLGYDPIWFGVTIVIVATMGVITPPVGVNVFVVKGIAKEVPLETIFSGIWPFLIAGVICFLVLLVFPQIATFLPNLLLP
jgi:tripartite ATP-independent transporter DctM subunit